MLVRGVCTWIERAGGCCPAHYRWDGTHHGTHPGVGDAEAFQGSVAARVQEDVQGAQEASQGIYTQGQQGHTWDPTRQSEWHGMQRTERNTEIDKFRTTETFPMCSLKGSYLYCYWKHRDGQIQNNKNIPYVQFKGIILVLLLETQR